MNYTLPISLFLTLMTSWTLAQEQENNVPVIWQGLYQIEYGEKSLFYFEIQPDGKVIKRYPQPVAPLGQLVEAGGEWKIQLSGQFRNSKTHGPVIANIVDLARADEATLDFLRACVNQGAKTQIALTPIYNPETPEVKGMSMTSDAKFLRKINWEKLQVTRVPQAILKSIRDLEASLLGKWEFERVYTLNSKTLESVSDSSEPDLLGPCQETLEFCADGRCLVDGQETFYFSDGINTQFSLRAGKAPHHFTSLNQYDFHFKEQTFCVRTRPVGELSLPTSHLTGLNTDYIYEYRFRKVPPAEKQGVQEETEKEKKEDSGGK